MQITLNGIETYKLIGWKQKHFLNQTQSNRKTAIEKLSIDVLSVNGDGLKALYEIDIPDTFWDHLTIPKIHINEVSKRYLKWLTTNNCMMDTVSNNQVILFDREIADMIAGDLGINMETTRTTIKRIKRALRENEYFYEDDRRSMHRFKYKKQEEWITGDDAVSLHIRAKAKWKRFHDRNTACAQRINHEWDRAPQWLIRDEIQRFCAKGLADELELEDGVYKAATLMVANYYFHEDIEWARTTFLETKDMELVRNKLSVRQEGYREEKVKREREIKKSIEASNVEDAKVRPHYKEQELYRKQFQKELRIGAVHRIPSDSAQLESKLDEIVGIE